MLITIMARIISLEAEKLYDENEELLRSKKFGVSVLLYLICCVS